MKYALFFLILFSCKQVSPKVENFENSTGKNPLSSDYSEIAENISINVAGLPPSEDDEGVYRISVSGTDLSAFALKFGPEDSIDCLSSALYTSHKIDEIATIDISQQASGTYSLCVIGGSKSAVWQKYSNATTHVWTYNKVEGAETIPVMDDPSPEGSVEVEKCKDNLPPPSEDGVTYGCEKQKEWGKCSRPWMSGYCDKTCGRC